MRDRHEHLRAAAIVYSLRSVPLFSGLPEENLQQIAGFAIVKAIGKGEYLFREKTPAVGFYIVRKGIINIHRVAADGREQVIHLFRPGESFAEAAIVSESGYPADARAVENSEVILIPKQEFLAQLRQRADLALRMLASLSLHMRILVSSLESLTLKDAETRFMHWLLKRCPRPLSHKTVELNIGMTKTVLASEIGTRHETLSRLLAKLRDGDYLTVRGRIITIRDPLALQRAFETNLGERLENS